MTARGRLLAIKLLEQQERNPEYLKQLGVQVHISKVESTDNERRKHPMRNPNARKYPNPLTPAERRRHLLEQAAEAAKAALVAFGLVAALILLFTI